MTRQWWYRYIIVKIPLEWYSPTEYHTKSWWQLIPHQWWLTYKAVHFVLWHGMNSTQSGMCSCTLWSKYHLVPLFENASLPWQLLPSCHTDSITTLSYSWCHSFMNGSTHEMIPLSPTFWDNSPQHRSSNGCVRRSMAQPTLALMTAQSMVAHPHSNSTRKPSLTTCPISWCHRMHLPRLVIQCGLWKWMNWSRPSRRPRYRSRARQAVPNIH